MNDTNIFLDITKASTALKNALLVMVLTPHILKYLEQTDPMALKQAKEALLAVGANPEPEILDDDNE